MKIHHFILLFNLIYLCSILLGCSASSGNEKKIADIAAEKSFDNMKKVYILEAETYVPFLVLSDDYQDKVLLLREEVMDASRRFNDRESYYQDSEMDQYLSSDYYNLLEDSIKEKIEPMEIQIMDKQGIGVAGEETEWITRKVFLLGYEEFGLMETGFTPLEGTTISCFGDADTRVALNSNKPQTWWLRTSYTAQPNSVFVILNEGQIGLKIATEESGVRPAFCVSPDTEIIENDQIIKGESVYVVY